MHLDHCPNCKRQFYAHTEGAYCPECWSGWMKSDGSFERRTKKWADLVIDTPAGRAALSEEEERG